MTIRVAVVRACGVAAAVATALLGGAAAQDQPEAAQATAEQAAREAAGDIETGRRADEGALSYAGWARIGEGSAAAEETAPSDAAEAGALLAWEALSEGAAFTPRRAQVTLLDGEASVAVAIVGGLAPEPSASSGEADHQILLSAAAGEALGRSVGERFLVIVEPAAPAKP